jgi:iron complex outermembrane receptor protein
VMLPAAIFAQNVVNGKVVDSGDGAPVFGALVYIEGTQTGCITDTAGKFSFSKLSGNECCFTVKMISYQTKKVCVTFPQNDLLTIQLKQDTLELHEVNVNATRADENSAMAYTNLSKADLQKNNNGQDLPWLLDQTPSVVTTSDAGAGFGYTGIRIRGTDNTRVNVTINGIPVNDAESQGTYWVDLPDVVSSTDNIQIQRGAGTSTNGAGAFGGSINLQTDAVQPKPYGEIMTSGGSFNTFRTTLKAGTGLMQNGWTFDTRVSKINSDGYIDRGFSDLRSWYVSGGYYGKNFSMKAIAFSGKERTYQCWYGVPEDSVKAGNYTYNPAGEYYDANGEVHYYGNETDNYQQDYYQLHFLFRGNDDWDFHVALHATKGKGFYEEFRQGDDLFSYGLDTSIATDLVRRLWLDNWFYGITYGAQYDSHKKTKLIIGGAANNYEGQHYNEITWAQFLPAGTTDPYRYEFNFAHKSDVNIFARLNYQLTEKLNAFVDLQFRNVGYHFDGLDTNGSSFLTDATLNFFNPKAGLTFRANEKNLFYYSFSTAHKEPNRDDYRSSTINSRPSPEILYDNEAGWKFGNNQLVAGVNFYYMYYVNQLVLTGKVNDVGAYTRVNVPQSYRAGAELEAGYYLLNKSLFISGNATLSSNKIKTYVEYLDDYDFGGQTANVYTNTDIAFSPSAIGAISVAYQSKKGFSAAITDKYVSQQFLDNTSNDTRKLDAYSVANLRLSYTFRPKSFKEITVSAFANNLFNKHYASNGYSYGYIYGGETSYYNYYYPQAGINFLGMVDIKF